MDYSTFFNRFGKIIKSCNSLEAIPDGTIPAVLSDVSSAFAANRLPISGIETTVAAWQSATDQWRTQLVTYGTSYLTSDEIIATLGLTSADVNVSLTALIAQMIVDLQTIDRSAISIGAPAFVGVGNGKLMTSTLLDGITAPVSGATARRQYAGQLSELAVPSETVRLVCVQDSYTDRRSSGSELFQVSGAQNKGAAIGFATEGSGSGPQISTVEANTKVQNGTFESFSVANTPDQWTIVAGTPGTHIKQSTGTFFRDASALQLVGDGALSSIELTQPVSVSPLGIVVISVWIKADASITGGNLTIQFKGTGYSAASSEKIAIAPGSLPINWTHYTAFVVPPAVLPADWKLSIAWTGTPQATRNIWIDSMAVASPNYHGGVAYALTAGNTDFVRGDQFSVAVTNDGAGVVQEFFRRAYATQLPSSVTPTINDSVAA
jgi:hypothetical protein